MRNDNVLGAVVRRRRTADTLRLQRTAALDNQAARAGKHRSDGVIDSNGLSAIGKITTRIGNPIYTCDRSRAPPDQSRVANL